jgi:hypothetical protein
MSRRVWQLEGDLRQALSNYMGGENISGPWDAVIEALAAIVDGGGVTLEGAARLNYLLSRTTGQDPDACDVCQCPYPDQVHR